MVIVRITRSNRGITGFQELGLTEEDEMTVKDVMTKDPACCTAETSLVDVARLMVENDCGSSPVVENEETMKLVGIITDRDITCRSVAWGKNPLELTVKECMTTPCISVTPETSLEECCQLMERHQLRRITVVDSGGACCGIVAQADIAKHASSQDTATVVRQVSQPDEEVSYVTAS